jgi:hypothetical protein
MARIQATTARATRLAERMQSARMRGSGSAAVKDAGPAAVVALIAVLPVDPSALPSTLG